jgi:hypothetical protein
MGAFSGDSGWRFEKLPSFGSRVIIRGSAISHAQAIAMLAN